MPSAGTKRDILQQLAQFELSFDFAILFRATCHKNGHIVRLPSILGVSQTSTHYNKAEIEITRL